MTGNYDAFIIAENSDGMEVRILYLDHGEMTENDMTLLQSFKRLHARSDNCVRWHYNKDSHPCMSWLGIDGNKSDSFTDEHDFGKCPGKVVHIYNVNVYF
jgi:hypothetical protein